MSVVSILCSAKKSLKVAAVDEVPFVRDDGTVVITQRAPWRPYVDQQDRGDAVNPGQPHSTYRHPEP
jgi:hypothetical protein